MARVQISTVGHFVVAETPEELQLLAHGRRHGGQIVLLDAYYRVQGDRLLLPGTTSGPSAERVRHAFHCAALNHRRAEQRRRTFRIV